MTAKLSTSETSLPALSRVVDLTSGKRSGGFVLLALDWTSIKPRAFYTSCNAEGNTSQDFFGHVNGGGSVRLSGTLEYRPDLGRWLALSRVSGSVTSKGLEYLAAVLGPVADGLRSDSGAVLAHCAEEAAHLVKSSVSRLNEFDRLRNLALDETARAIRFSEDLEAGGLARVLFASVPAHEVTGPNSVDGAAGRGLDALPWGTLVIVHGRILGAVRGAYDGRGGWRGEVLGMAPRDWLRSSGLSVSDFNAGALRLAYVTL